MQTTFVKTIAHASFVALACAFVFFGVATASVHAESIKDYATNVVIEKNGSLQLTETIRYDFGDQQKHGIYREIPLTMSTKPDLHIRVDNVTDAAGKPYTYEITLHDNSVYIKVGDAKKTITGEHTYIFHLVVDNAMRTFDDHEELYWNAVGTDWYVPIEHASVTVTLPNSTITASQTACFTGTKGSATDEHCSIAQSGPVINFTTTTTLNSMEGLTFVVGFPRGYMTNTYIKSGYSSGRAIDYVGGVFFLFFIGNIAFAGLIMTIRRRRANTPKTLRGKPVVVAYAPPKDLEPIDVGALYDGGLQNEDIASLIVDLAIKGYVQIQYIDKKNFKLIKKKDGSDLKHPAYVAIFADLFDKRESVLLSEMQKTSKYSPKKIADAVKKYLMLLGHVRELKGDVVFIKQTVKKILISYVVSFVILNMLYVGFSWYLGMAPVKMASATIQAWPMLFVMAVIGGTVAVVTLLQQEFARLTDTGVVAFAQILGFRQFLRATETDRLRLTNAPELKPEVFEKFLPYAMVLRVEKEWAKKFEGIYTQSPDWYTGPAGHAFHPGAFASSLHHMGRTLAPVTPHSASGFSGGHSGGGGGGGGGGSW